MHSRRHVSTASLAALLSLATTHHARAQSADLSTATLGAARVSLEAAALLQPQPGYYSLTATGSFLRFVSERWQLGLSSSFSGFTGKGQTSLASTVMPHGKPRVDASLIGVPPDFDICMIAWPPHSAQ